MSNAKAAYANTPVKTSAVGVVEVRMHAVALVVAAVIEQAAEQVDKFLASFGLSPSSRSRVTTSDNRQAPLPFEGGSKNSWDQV